MSYIKQYFDEIKDFVTDSGNLSEACRAIKKKYNIERSVNALRKSYKSYEEHIHFSENSEIKSQTKNKHGEVISEKVGKKQEEYKYDPKNYIVERFTTNPFGKGVWAKFVNIDLVTGLTPEEFEKQIFERIPKNIKPLKIKPNNRSGVYALADFHLGAYVGDLLKTPDFNYNVICEYLQEISQEINKEKHKEVHIFLAGDFIESFSGLNHINSWKGLSKGAYGMKAVMLAHEVLCEHLYSKIKNLKYVGFVSGNHDRISSSKDEDQHGEVAMMMQYLFNKDVKNVDSEWSALLLRKVIDGVGYVVTHGHLGISDKEISKVLFDYGFQGMYNVFLKGHKHTRSTKRTFKKSLIKYEDIDYVSLDSTDYRAVTIPPLFTGNFYSESLGYTSTAGFAGFINNGKGKVKYTDYCL
jgi:hypothetical protein